MQSQLIFVTRLWRKHVGVWPGFALSLNVKRQKPAEGAFWNELKLTDKPHSFIESGVDSHSFHTLQKAKTPPRRGFL